jgi:hydrogenase nickel incorporation protein HypB
MAEKVEINAKVLSENEQRAAAIRRRLKEHRIVCLNLVSSPGAGKTTLLEHTLARLNNEFRISLVAGDVQTENDANRLIRAGGRQVQPIVTRGACHLDAGMVEKSLAKITLEETDLLFIENVGNLVCPSSYDLGEDAKVVIVSVTEGEDKPLKYPGMFRRSSLMIISKTDLLPHCPCQIDELRRNALSINGDLEIISLSALTGEAMDQWYAWLRSRILSARTGVA